MQATSIDGLVAHCQAGRFTGILRVRARGGIGEVWFLSGLVDEVRFGVSTGDEAMDRMRTATDATYELVARLPHPAGGFKRHFPSKGSIATATPVTLMRYCERYALTCTLAVEDRDVLVEATYSLGELVTGRRRPRTTTASRRCSKRRRERTSSSSPRASSCPAGTPIPAHGCCIAARVDAAARSRLGFRALLEAQRGRRADPRVTRRRSSLQDRRDRPRQQKSAPTRPVPRPVATSKPAPAPTSPRAQRGSEAGRNANQSCREPAEPVKPATASSESEPVAALVEDKRDRRACRARETCNRGPASPRRCQKAPPPKPIVYVVRGPAPVRDRSRLSLIDQSNLTTASEN